jgi:hypothetical protein
MAGGGTVGCVFLTTESPTARSCGDFIMTVFKLENEFSFFVYGYELRGWSNEALHHQPFTICRDRLAVDTNTPRKLG